MIKDIILKNIDKEFLFDEKLNRKFSLREIYTLALEFSKFNGLSSLKESEYLFISAETSLNNYIAIFELEKLQL